jgi:hypothetical protein
MKISKIHQGFANRLYPQDALNHPENFLGPNWREVINFWLYLDTLTEDQLRVAQKRYFALRDIERDIAYSRVSNGIGVAINFYVPAGHVALCGVTCANNAARYATYEIAVLEELLEQGHEPVFFPMFLNL